MNKKLQNEIRDFIGDDPAKAVERVRYFEGKYDAQVLLRDAISLRMSKLPRRVVNPAPMTSAQWITNEERRWDEVYGLAAYGAGLAAVMDISHQEVYGRAADYFGGGNDRGTLAAWLAEAATADAETRIAAMLWAAAWIVEVNEGE